MEENKNTDKNKIWKDIFPLLIPFIMITIVELFFKIVNNALITINMNYFIFSVIIGYIIYGILMAITKKYQLLL